MEIYETYESCEICDFHGMPVEDCDGHEPDYETMLGR